jgi:hypothetical protein
MQLSPDRELHMQDILDLLANAFPTQARVKHHRMFHHEKKRKRNAQ